MSMSSPAQAELSDLDRLKANDGGYYIGSPNLQQSAEFHIGGREGNILVVKNKDSTPTEFVLRGIFQIDRRDFFFTADANHDPHNAFNIELATIKATCRLLPVTREEQYLFSLKDFDKIITNLRTLEKLAPRQPGQTIFSCVNSNEGGSTDQYIKLSHSLFKKKVSKSDEDKEDDTEASNKDDDDSDTTESTFDITEWPVQDRCKDELKKLSTTHDVKPIPAYGRNGKRVQPTDYERRLRGAIVEVHFVLVHHYIRKAKRSTFNAVLRQMHILRPPINIIKSPLKSPKKRYRTEEDDNKEEATSSKKSRTST